MMRDVMCGKMCAEPSLGSHEHDHLEDRDNYYLS